MASKKRSPKRSARLALRKREQKEGLIANDRARLFALSPGGSRLMPIEVSSPAVIETRAQTLVCSQCGGRFAVKEHEVDRQSDALLRIVAVHCVNCGRPQKLWFRVVQQRPN